MAHHKSAIKRIRTSEKSRQRNRSNRSRLRHLLVKLNEAKDKEVIPAAGAAVAAVDHYARKGLIHPNKAARIKSRAQKKAFAASKA